ncbi:AAA family ATPase [Geodermatophilus sabuli]|uniref:Pilus assembly protein CpaE n=1 Tax=Geodermatophilus sabuli TaxID=1564158 RepID=A0A285E788_9ACTN|nr:AAA family ATPase [Geodermatophilus sabuli]MBB3082242.1 pilus assembly protein CpaE [Geodermatophilus sabuli]SNX94885.1 pilus assembly protein CpaE [Geodermatophilus sabuli]
MSRVVLAAADDDLGQRVHVAADGDVQVLPPGRLPGDPARLFEQLLDGELPDVLLIGPLAPPQEVLPLAQRLDVQCPGISVVLLAEPSPEMLQAAMRAGIRDLLAPGADVEEIRAAVERAGSAAAGRRRVLRPMEETARYTGRVITIASPKGGVGKTTIASNLALGLTTAAPQSTVLVDLDVQFGDVASALGLVPEYTLPDAVQGPASEDTMVLKTFLTQHPSGLYAVCGAESPAAGDTVTGADVTRLLTALAREFRYVVVDTAPGLSEQTLAALDRATDVVMLSSMDVPGVRGLRKELDVLRELCMIPAGRHVVMNLADPKGGLSVRDVETAIGTGVDVVIPRSAAVPASTNQGVPILASGRKDPAVKELRRLVARFAATPLMKPGRYRAKHRAAS